MTLIAENSEAFVLGKVIYDQATYWDIAVAAGISTDHFGNEENRALWRLLAKRIRRGFTVTPAALTDANNQAANPQVLSRALEAIMVDGLFSDHLAILQDRLARRIMHNAIMANMDANAETTMAELVAAIKDAQNVLSQDTGISTIKEAAREFLAEQEANAAANRLPGIPTGFEQLDVLSGGMRPGQFWVIAGRPSEGKSVMMLQIALKAAKDGRRVLLVSLEMSKADVVARLLSCFQHIRMNAVTNLSDATGYEKAQLRQGVEELIRLDLHIIDASDMTIEKIGAMAGRLAESRPIDLLVIDYLQLISSPAVKGQSREGEVAAISRGCKNLAKRLKCPLLTGSQLNEQGVTRESRAIAQDCDALLAIKNGGDEDGVKVRKMRNGERGRILDLTLNGLYQKFD